MKIQNLKSKVDDSKVKAMSVGKTRHRNTHPILQQQQTVGNKAATRMIQRHDSATMNRYGF